ncbi:MULTISPECIES: LuxR C-terminal-related transcriptional regulator [unclassified Haladaptatus]|uniref:LuxR C-terminal-related transcriptional regulator n=1 Tax=unclassified Haladaptatus TaxID=2622732 RepID=UPI0023E7F299|nr:MULTISPECIES: LuxR C-terminal-related transcriptional regulator [unclassified Haladaptatus]
MDEKTESLRNLFLEVAGDATVTEQQEEGRGSLTPKQSVDERLRAVIAKMRDRYEFTTDLSDGDLAALVNAYYDEVKDATIAKQLDVSPATVFRARMDLHLIRERDLDASFEVDALRAALSDGKSVATIADELDIAESTVRRHRRIIETQAAIRRVSQRFVSEFEEILDATGSSMTKSARETGLEDATEGMESNVSF